MKKQTFTTKRLKFNLPALSSYQMSIEDSYVNAIKYGAIAGLVAVFLIVAFIILILI
ncbi:hypothetical protein GXP67_25060 [Rhodocytophaga rosea]|uniref:Uncharacterized protein n=1 Tax=Rhodocytophaga rosea TaxID=2704465 RepID=A0A6C0GQ20_9BACT|nr:hypothetical protein [Rhodocytophaga rosea]QHT69682.1 hypothetical protein GXP67_25060 [Rhodocytophaga rosea]